ncbi:exosortase Y-associated Wzy-like protein [Pedobacter cryotolerans]|uniref:Oligosaccharide repeat unit polymerase n=1 Tax=Pedobacter cryotolerans TaxID=2571270 RepID=A0A4U1BYQ0_9SPHI|nr:hypothetical protein [Pedobacter cryotolerans]TKB98223.1 hypothetical protein FA045_14675 [Pedobacter cryotolerans]
MSSIHPLRYLLLYIPFLLAWLILKQAHAAYIVAWAGSFYIFYLSYSGVIKPLPKDHKIFDQLMRPIFLMQLIFAGYMCFTSIFYYINAVGYEYFDYTGNSVMFKDDLYLAIAKCQMYYVLGHAALVHGILSQMNYPVEKKYNLYTPSVSNLLLGISIVCLPIGYAFGKVGALSQFSIQLTGISFVAGTIALAFAIREQKRTNILLAGALFTSNLMNALVSGFKEPIIICVLLLGVFLLPIYGKKIVPVFSVILIALFFVLPTFIGNFRNLAGQGLEASELRDQSIDAVFNTDETELKEDNWEFLIYRFSEIDMFIKYVNSTPNYIPYYKTHLLKDAATSIIPRFLWPGKPIIEDMVMQRVYNAGVVSRQSVVSAKPAYIVDCYLSYGMIGIFIGLFAYGAIAQWIAIKAEKLFGSYFMGCAVIFAGLFQILWRGNSFEFLVNSVFWSVVTMYIFHFIFKAKGILEEA